MILESAPLCVKPGQEAAFEAAFAQAQQIIAAMPGYLGHELGRCLERPGEYLLLVRWQTLADHEQGFRGSPQYQQWKALLHHFYDPFPTVSHYAPVVPPQKVLLSHVFLGVADFDRALAFYRRLMPVLGVAERFCVPAESWAGWQVSPGLRPLFVIGRPYNGQPHEPGNGQMAALQADSRAQVGAAHAAALAAGGTCEGPPGLRPHYHPNYYGAYFRDTEGNKLGVACHRAEG
jgi:lactoylglutathione lyase